MYALVRLVIIVDKSMTSSLISRLSNLTRRTSRKWSLKKKIYMYVCVHTSKLFGSKPRNLQYTVEN